MGLMDVLRGMQYGPRGQPASRSGTGSGTGTGTGSTGRGMSPITMAILGLLAYRALKSMSHREQPTPAGGPPRPAGGDGGDAARGMQSREIPSRDMSRGDMSEDMEPRDADMGRGMSGSMPGRGDVGHMGASESSGGGMGEQQGGSISDLLKGALGGLLGGTAAGGVMSGGLSDLLKQLQNGGFADAVESWVGPGENRRIPPGDLSKVLGEDQIEAMMQHSGLSREEVLDGLSKHLPEVVDQLTPEGKVPRHIPM